MGKVMVPLEIVQAVDGMQLAARIQDAGKGQKHIDVITVKGHPSITAGFPEEGRDV